MKTTPLRGLYAITSSAICRDAALLEGAVAAALDGGATLVQYRDKQNDAATRTAFARRLVALCHARGARLIVNDDPELALHAGADGVHLGARDADPAAARARLPRAMIIGVSCANVLARARAAEDAGADYIALGRFFASQTKPDAPQATLALLREARATVQLPICAIGGVTPNNAAPLVAAGADLVAAVEGVFGARDIEAAARDYARLFLSKVSP